MTGKRKKSLTAEHFNLLLIYPKRDVTRRFMPVSRTKIFVSTDSRAQKQQSCHGQDFYSRPHSVARERCADWCRLYTAVCRPRATRVYMWFYVIRRCAMKVLLFPTGKSTFRVPGFNSTCLRVVYVCVCTHEGLPLPNLFERRDWGTLAHTMCNATKCDRYTLLVCCMVPELDARDQRNSTVISMLGCWTSSRSVKQKIRYYGRNS